jgi:hypothetical protein
MLGASMDDDLDTHELREALRRMGMRPSKSAEAARARELQEICAMSVEARMLLALRLGRRDRALREGKTAEEDS